MNSDQQPPVYSLRIRPLPDRTDPRGTRRLRWLLKILLRRLGFRCISVVSDP